MIEKSSSVEVKNKDIQKCILENSQQTKEHIGVLPLLLEFDVEMEQMLL